MQFSVDDLAAYITTHQIEACLHRDIGHTPTVPAAAHALGVATDQIVKTLLFTVQLPATAAESTAQHVVVISHGERRIDKAALGTHFGVGRKRVRLAEAAVVLEQLGYPAGGVPPFGHRTRLPVLLDASLTHLLTQLHSSQRVTIFAGGGDDQTMLELELAELLRVTQPEILPLSAA